MLQTLTFFIFIGTCALIFSKVESTTYVNGIYFTVVTILTIGFGDITPRTTAMKVIIFPVAVVGITILAIIVTSIVRLLSDRARRRKLQMKKRLKEKTSEKKRNYMGAAKIAGWISRTPSESGGGGRLKRSLTLQEELGKLREEDWERAKRANLRGMAIGLSVFFLFWFIGALAFRYVEVYDLGRQVDCRTGHMGMLCTFATCFMSCRAKLT